MKEQQKRGKEILEFTCMADEKSDMTDLKMNKWQQC